MQVTAQAAALLLAAVTSRSRNRCGSAVGRTVTMRAAVATIRRQQPARVVAAAAGRGWRRPDRLPDPDLLAAGRSNRT